MLSRRDLIGKAAAGAAAALAVGAGAGTAAAATRPLRDSTEDLTGDRDGRTSASERNGQESVGSNDDAAANAGPPPWALVAPLAAGAELAHGWRLADLTPVHHGSVVATLQNPRGHTHRVHLCRNSGTPEGLVYTRRVDFVVMNQGYGELPTEEHFGQAVAALAHAVAANEATVADGVFAALVPHGERVQRFAGQDGPLADGKLR